MSTQPLHANHSTPTTLLLLIIFVTLAAAFVAAPPAHAQIPLWDRHAWRSQHLLLGHRLRVVRGDDVPGPYN